ncbi:MAG: recombination protein O N-terminal domain-containing protein [Vampirovibrionales bacterium]|nr:recombination protein O N-terminal domain-containing protein [Vampirovibrionales bacterium]
MPETLITQAIVVKTRKLSENDRFLSCLTPSYGRLDVVAKGVRKANSKLAGACAGLAELKIQLALNPSHPALRQYETLQPFFNLRSHFLILNAAVLLAETAEKLLPAPPEQHSGWHRHPESEKDPTARIYYTLANSLMILDALALACTPIQDSPKALARPLNTLMASALMQMLKAAGHGLQLRHCIYCENETLSAQIEPSAHQRPDFTTQPWWYFSWSAHGVLCHSCHALYRGQGFGAQALPNLIKVSGSTLWFAQSLNPALTQPQFNLDQLVQAPAHASHSPQQDSLPEKDTLFTACQRIYSLPWPAAADPDVAAQKALKFTLAWLGQALPKAPKSLAGFLNATPQP